MDQKILVEAGQNLVRAMDGAQMTPRIAMWVHNTDTDTWKLWVVPPKGLVKKEEFYRRLADVISKHRDTLAGLDVSDIEMVSDSHPAMVGLGRAIRAPNLSSIFMSGNRYNGYYLPDGILLRSNLV